MMDMTRNIENFHWIGLVKSCGKDMRRKKRAALRTGIRFDCIFSNPLFGTGRKRGRSIKTVCETAPEIRAKESKILIKNMTNQ